MLSHANVLLLAQVPPPPSEKIGSQYPNREVYPSNWNTATKSEESIATDQYNGNIVLVSTNGSLWQNNYPHYPQHYGVGWYLSTDGGNDWIGDTSPIFGTNKGDPATAIDLDGTLYVGYLSS